MKVTDNLKNDISNAPDWFFKSIESQVKKKKIAISSCMFYIIEKNTPIISYEMVL